MARNTLKALLVALSSLVAPAAEAQNVFPQFGPSNGVMKGDENSPLTTSAVANDIISLWAGPCNSLTFLAGDGTCQPGTGTVLADPTALVGLTPVNGVATTAMRSDAAPALDQGIAPTWTSPHNFSSSIVVGAPTGGAQGAGTINATGLFVNGVAVGGGASGANPTASVGLTATNGVAPTFMRSDAAPALDQTINPTWAGTHIFNGTVDLAGPLKATGAEGISGQVLSSQGVGLPAVWRTSSGGSIELGWNYSSSVSLANPGSQKMSMNSALYSAVTFMTFNSLAFTNFDANTILSLLNTGNRVYCQQRNDATKAAVYQVTGTGTNNVTWWNIPVSFIDSRGAIFPNNADMNCVFILSVSGAVSGANPTASVGLTAVNGVATTFIRSDGAPALSQSIAPTWSGQHTWSLPLRAANGSFSVPSFSFALDPDTGMYSAGTDSADIAAGGTRVMTFSPTAVIPQVVMQSNTAGSVSTPAYSFVSDPDIGLYRVTTDTIGLVTNSTDRLRINASGSFGLSGPNFGTAGQVLTSQGNAAAPTWTTVGGGGGTPGGADTNVQYNNAGAFAGSSTFTWDNSTSLLALGSSALPATIRPPIFPISGTQLTISGGPTSGVGGTAGGVQIGGGVPTDGDGGAVSVFGRGGIGTNRGGGSLTLNSGSSTGVAGAGSVSVTAGAGGTAGTAGTVTIAGGAGGTTSGAGGALTIRGGHSTAGIGAGGNVSLSGGNATSTGAAGTVTVSGGNSVGAGVIGGTVLIQGGSPADGTGGFVNIQGRNGAGATRAGGGVNITAGTGVSTGNGGSIALNAGISPSGTHGSVSTITGGVERLEILGNGGWELSGALGTAGQVLTSQAGAPPIWSNPALAAADFANPTASLGLTAINGSATTAMRSDAAPALNQAILPVWTGNHTWSSSGPTLIFTETDGGVDSKNWLWTVNGGSAALQTVTDSTASPHTALSFNRSVNTVSGVFLGNATDNPPFSFLGTGTVTSGGVHQGPLGAVSAPTYAFSGDSNTGMYNIGIDQLAFSTNSTERLRFDATGAWGLSGANFGTAGQVLTSQGNATSPTWTSVGGGVTGLANPTASVALTAVNGSATTAMRSDAAPALAQNISPTWTGAHSFTGTPTLFGTTTSASVGNTARMQEFGTTVQGASQSIVIGSADAVGPRIAFGKTRSTAYDALTPVVASDVLGSIVFNGADGTTLNTTGATISALAFGTVSTGVVPGELRFSTTSTAGTLSERLRLNSQGAFGLGGANFGTAGQVFTSQGNAAVPTWTTVAGGVTGLANPTATIGLTAVNGSATTALRSDGAPALSQAITPTWTGAHKFTADITALGVLTSGFFPGVEGGAGSLLMVKAAGGVDAKAWDIQSASTNQIQFRAINDAFSIGREYITATRSGVAIAGLDFGNVTDNPVYTFAGTGAVVSGGVHRGPIASAAGPTYSFSGDIDTGIYGNGADSLGFASGGVSQLVINPNAVIVTGSAGAGAIYLQDKSVSNPALAFLSDQDTGLYSAGADQLGLTTGGVAKLIARTTDILTAVPVLVPNGAVGAPTFSFTGDTDTGVYTDGANQLSFTAGGVRKLALFSSGAQFDTGSIYVPFGSVSTPAYTFTSEAGSGLYRVAANTIGLSAAGILGLQVANVGATTQVSASNGTVSNPGYTFLVDNNTGFWAPSAQDVRFSAGGSQTVQLTTAALGSLNIADPGSTFQPVGYRNVPQNSQSANYTATAVDAGKHLLHPSAGGAGDVFTIPSNASVAYPLGTTITFVNRDSNAVSIAITTDTLILGGTATTGTRTLGQNGVATAIKVEATVWIITGTGVT